MTAKQTQRVCDALADDGIDPPEKLDCLDETGNANDRVAATYGPDFAKDLRQFDGVVARLGAFAEFIDRA